jgi:hypothetical protein
MAQATEQRHKRPVVVRHRAVIAGLIAALGTLAVFLGVVDLHPPVTTWVPSAVGLVGLEVAYSSYNDLWLLVRLLLGAYITVVLLVVALQLVGTWRRLIVDAGGES